MLWPGSKMHTAQQLNTGENLVNAGRHFSLGLSQNTVLQYIALRISRAALFVLDLRYSMPVALLGVKRCGLHTVMIVGAHGICVVYFVECGNQTRRINLDAALCLTGIDGHRSGTNQPPNGLITERRQSGLRASLPGP